MVINITGGLGNQMFQYAYAKAMEHKGYEVKIDITGFETYALHGGYQLDNYCISLDIINKQEAKKFYKRSFLSKVMRRMGISNGKVLIDKNFIFDPKWLSIPSDSYVVGYFQSEKYFMSIREILLQEFIIKDELSPYTQEIVQNISAYINTCSIHIRRGDYLTKKNSIMHGFVGLDYYNQAIEFLQTQKTDIHFFIFSDEIDWAQQNIRISNALFIDNNTKRLPHEDIFLMSLCKDNIVANSSFSWWGAWLNQNKEKIVIAPQRWFANQAMQNKSQDIVCNGWLRL